jgi:DNA-binding XRE family transcriptional regulator
MSRPRGHRINRPALEAFMLLAGTTQTQLAELAELKRATLTGIIGGYAGASTPIAHKIAAALGCPPAAIFPTMLGQFTESPEAVAS